MEYIIIIYAVFSIHSGYYLVMGITKESDFTSDDIFQLIVAILFPIVAHIATYMTYYYKPSGGVIFKRRL